MKQDIYCPDCTREIKKIIGKGFTGEHTRFLAGRALREYRCDYCGIIIVPLAECTAASVWTDTNPYIKGWEQKFIIAEGDPAK